MRVCARIWIWVGLVRACVRVRERGRGRERNEVEEGVGAVGLSACWILERWITLLALSVTVWMIGL